MYFTNVISFSMTSVFLLVFTRESSYCHRNS